MGFSRSLAVLFLGLLLVAVAFFPTPVWAQQSDASATISAAQSKLVSCFDIARAAEAAGANISSLTDTLNVAGALLSNAEHAYSVGDFARAQSLSVESQNMLSNFVSEANSLESTATQNRNMDFLVNIVGSLSGTVAVLVGSVVVWMLLKRKYGNSGAQEIESTTV